LNSEKWKQRNIPLLLVIFIVAVIFFVIQSFRIPYEARQVTVGAVLLGSKADRGWNEGHFNGLMNACREQGCELKIREDIQEAPAKVFFTKQSRNWWTKVQT
jgi:basic membrane protein A